MGSLWLGLQEIYKSGGNLGLAGSRPAIPSRRRAPSGTACSMVGASGDATESRSWPAFLAESYWLREIPVLRRVWDDCGAAVPAARKLGAGGQAGRPHHKPGGESKFPNKIPKWIIYRPVRACYNKAFSLGYAAPFVQDRSAPLLMPPKADSFDRPGSCRTLNYALLLGPWAIFRLAWAFGGSTTAERRVERCSPTKVHIQHPNEKERRNMRSLMLRNILIVALVLSVGAALSSATASG